MRLTPKDRDKYHIIAIVLIVLVAVGSGVLAAMAGNNRSEQIRSQLLEQSQIMAAALGSQQVLQLKGQPSDAQLQVYSDLKEELADIKRANPDIRSVYLTGNHNGRLFFYVDSETPDSDDYSPAADWYDDATPAFKGIFKTGKAVVEGPVSDSYGTFISGLAPIYTMRGSHRVAAVIGMDVEASTYWRDVVEAAAVPLLAGLILVMVIAVFEWIRQRNAQLMDVRSELVSVASHELRNPITGIRWASESLQKLVTDPEALPMVRAIHSSALRLQSSTDDILELSHTMNKRKPVLAEGDMTAIIHEVIETQALSAQQKGVTITTDASWPASLTLTCDIDKIKRALHNVLSNAIKYTEDNTAVVISYKQDQTFHHMLITDQGIGIPVSEQEKVFKGFYRASNAVASHTPGTGLGLFLVKAVIEQHHGKVTFMSQENKGTTFDIALPKSK